MLPTMKPHKQQQHNVSQCCGGRHIEQTERVVHQMMHATCGYPDTRLKTLAAHVTDVAGGHPGLALHVLVAQVLPETAHAAALGAQWMIRRAWLAAAIPEIHVQVDGHVHDVREDGVPVALRIHTQVQACRETAGSEPHGSHRQVCQVCIMCIAGSSYCSSKPVYMIIEQVKGMLRLYRSLTLR